MRFSFGPDGGRRSGRLSSLGASSTSAWARGTRQQTYPTRWASTSPGKWSREPLVMAGFSSSRMRCTRPFGREVSRRSRARGSFYYLPDSVRALRAFHRLLTPGGRVVILSPLAWFLRPVVRIFDRREYAKLANDAGFSLEKFEDLQGVACFVVMKKPSSLQH